MKRTLVALLLGSGIVSAQEMPVPDGKGRLLRIHDLDKVRPPRTGPGPEQRLEPPKELQLTDDDARGGARATVPSLLRLLIDPPLRPGDDLQVLGDRWLTLLGTPAQSACLDKLLAGAAAQKNGLIEVAIEVIRVPKAAFETDLAKRLAAGRQGDATRWQLAMPVADATALTKAAGKDAETLTAPRLSVFPLDRAEARISKQIPYVKDFTVSRNGGAVIADPILDTVVDGIVAEALAIPLDRDLLAIACSLQVQDVQQPLAEFETTIAEGNPVKIQLPRVTGVRFDQVVRLRTEERMVFAAQKADGSYLVTVLGARLVSDETK